jgi:hypothetical protein
MQGCTSLRFIMKQIAMSKQQQHGGVYSQSTPITLWLADAMTNVNQQ